MLNFRGDGQEQEEIRQMFNSLQSALGTNTKQVLDSVQELASTTNAVDNSQHALHDGAREISRQIVSLNSSFTISFNEMGKFLENSVNTLYEHSQTLEAALHQQEKRADAHAHILTQRLAALETSLLERLQHLDEWKRTLPPDEIADETGWLDHIKADLYRLGQSKQLRGNAHLFAVQLAKHLRVLQKWNEEIAARDTTYFNDKFVAQELDRTLYRPHFDVEWIDIGDDEYGEAGMKSRARAELRALETAVLNYRRRLQAQLKQRHNFAPIAIVIHQTIFDPALHETSEMYSLPTNDQARDNRIIGVERNGYQCGGEVLERALVRRLLWDESAPMENSVASEAAAADNVDESEHEIMETVTMNEDDLNETERERRANEAMNL